MASERLYDLAGRYKKTKLWNKVFEDQLFAVRLADGEIGYCSVMGIAREHIAISMYIGAKGLTSLWRLYDSPIEMTGAFPLDERMLMQDCLQCSFERKDLLLREELAEARQYAKAHGFAYRGRNAFPRFIKYQPFRFPWPVTQADEDNMCRMLSAAIEVADKLTHSKARELGFSQIQAGKYIPLLEYDGTAFVWDTTKLPEPLEQTNPSPKLDEFTAARLRNERRQGILACKLTRVFQPSQAENGEAPYFPITALCLYDDGVLMPGKLIRDYENKPVQALTRFAQGLLEEGCMPAIIQVCDDRTEAFLRQFCEQIGIMLQRRQELPELEELEMEMQQQMLDSGPLAEETEMLDEMLTMLMQMDDQEIATIPNAVRDGLMEMKRAGVLPEAVANRLTDVFGD